ncbi:SGNH/GDSL hydrolase family protein [Dyella sp. 2HG41-7]|uniref:SGNH/GDSL hydrolase family protein n=1 Tax=Dyella sp. 2HG41-7 TaxID=2883239 RepID=UPI001F2655C3|nr:SGNH/GDSL hydrolase family protein [Dyella sp. 2HG41-7]
MNAKIWMASAVLGVFACAAAVAQSSSKTGAQPVETVGVVHNPCAALPPEPAIVQAFMAQVDQAKAHHQSEPQASAEVNAASKAWNDKKALEDFGNLCRYRDANAALAPATSHRVVFMGDSITEFWGAGDPKLFTNDVVNRGISGQTTSQMVLRFQADVIDLHPAIVHILAGTNDIAGNTGPTSLDAIENNIAAMVDMARAHRIRVVLAALTPVARYPWRPSVDSIPTIKALNDWIKTYADKEGLTYVDYFTPLDDGHRGFKAKLANDGVHPNPAGYAVMSRLAKAAVVQAQSKTP